MPKKYTICCANCKYSDPDTPCPNGIDGCLEIRPKRYLHADFEPKAYLLTGKNKYPKKDNKCK